MKEEKTIKQLEKRLRFVRVLLFISFICFFIILFLFSSAVLTNYRVIDTLKKEKIIPQSFETVRNITNITINFTDLTEDEREIAKNLILSMKNIYLLPQKSITFSHDISEFYGEGYGNLTTAFNQNKGEIYILWRNNTKDVAISICHETFHTVMSNSEHVHAIIYDLAEYLTCFKEKKDE